MKYVKTYLRSFITVDGRVVTDEPAEFTEVQSRSHHSMYFDPERGYRQADAEKLVAHWTFMGIPHGQTYRLQDDRDLLRIAERDYEDALGRLRALGCEPNVYRQCDVNK